MPIQVIPLAAKAQGLPIELACLAVAALFGLLQPMLTGWFTRRQKGSRWASGARDEDRGELSGMGGRVERAFKNYLETFAFFVAAVVTAVLAHRLNAFTAWGAQIYVWARLVYLPLYAFGVPVVRSLVWAVAWVGVILILVGLIYP